jgi:hypothetical protein
MKKIELKIGKTEVTVKQGHAGVEIESRETTSNKAPLKILAPRRAIVYAERGNDGDIEIKQRPGVKLRIHEKHTRGDRPATVEGKQLLGVRTRVSLQGETLNPTELPSEAQSLINTAQELGYRLRTKIRKTR